MIGTIDEIADRLAVSREAADHLIKFLLAMGGATVKGRRPRKVGMGSKIYAIAESAPAAVMRLLTKATR